MKKIAYTLFFLIILGIIFFSFFIGNQRTLSKKKTDLTEQEHYCVFKGGEIKEKDFSKICVLGELKMKVEDFFIYSLREEGEVQKIEVKS